jgi:hypothetical protein
MTRNIGRLDQILRIGISLGLVYAGFIDKQLIHDDLSSYIIGIIGALNLVVALIRYCPLYVVTGINTCAEEK